MKIFFFYIIFPVIFASSVFAQTPRNLARHCPEVLTQILSRAQGLPTAELGAFLTFDGGRDCMTALLLTQYSGADSLTDRAEQVKAALQQNGSSAGGGGGTNLVSKGMTSQFISAAAEYGGLTETTSGQTVNIAGSMGGIPSALTGKAVIDNCDGIRIPGAVCVSNAGVNMLNRLSYTVAFNTGSTAQSVSGTTTSTSTSSAQPVTFMASTNTVTSASAKFVLLRGAAASITDTAAAIDKLGTKTMTASQLAPIKTTLNAMGAYDNQADVIAWRKQTAAKILVAGPGDATNVWLQQASSLMAAVCPANSPNPNCRGSLLRQLGTYTVFVNGYKASVNAFIETLRKAPLLTIEYDINRPASQPTNSTVRAVGQTILGGWTLTGNAAVSIYNSTPSATIPGASLLRDVQFAGEASFDFSKLKKATLLGHSAASTAYYFQDQTSPAILNVTPGQPAAGVTFTGLPSTATQVYAAKGLINIIQGKFTYSPGSSSISLPISITWSNRTELVTGSAVRGQIGISYDFDSLFASK